MVQEFNDPLEHTVKPSRLTALIALIIACVLPFFLVKSFPRKHRTTHLEKLSSQKASKYLDRSEKQNAEFLPKNPMTHSVLHAVPTTIETIAHKEQTTAKRSSKPPQQSQEDSKTLMNWVTIKTRNNDSLQQVFKRLGLPTKALQDIMHDVPELNNVSRLIPDKRLKIRLQKYTLEEIILPYTVTQYLVVSREDAHYKGKLQDYQVTHQTRIVQATVQGSLYATARRYKIPGTLVQQMTQLFASEINFAKEVRAGDQFTLLYDVHTIEDMIIGIGNLQAVNYKSRTKEYQAVFYTNKKGLSGYYSIEGMSLKKAFDRYPLKFSHISSPFNLSRFHPILRYKRAHKGIDLAAPIGTPIRATGDGIIAVIGRQNAYGNMIKIKHNDLYSTIYGHMLRFQKGLSKGDVVKRGQVIGYVGQTGLATGPHCHYEFRYKNQPQNPTTVTLPHGLAIPRQEIAAFKMQTAKLLATLQHSQSLKVATR